MIECAVFEKVSLEQFSKDMKALFGHHLYSDSEIEEIHSNIALPKRATSGSAGYDFFLPVTVNMRKDTPVIFPTGIRVKFTQEGWFLMCCPKSGLGFKYGMKLYNTLGIIDSDFYESDNEGHIMVKAVLKDTGNKDFIRFNSGDKFFQGIISHHGTIIGDSSNTQRNGGFGSTGR